MVEYLLQFTSDLITAYGSLGLFLAAGLEEMVTILPSIFIIMAGGFFFLGGEPITLSTLASFALLVVIPTALGLTLGSFVLYGLCRRYGKAFIDRYGRYLFLSWEDIVVYQKKMDGRALDRRALLFFRVVPIMPSISVNAFCGLVHWPLASYTVITLLGSTLRATILGLLGWQLGTLYKDYAEHLGRVQEYFFAAFGIGIVILVVFLYFRKKGRAGYTKETV